MAKKLQISVEGNAENILDKLKDRSITLFVTSAINEFAKKPEAKLFFKEYNNSVKNEQKIIEDNVIKEDKKTISEWE